MQVSVSAFTISLYAYRRQSEGTALPVMGKEYCHRFISAHLLLILLGVIACITQQTGACLRSSNPSEQVSGEITTTTTPLPDFVVKENCTSNETFTANCVNGGRCIARVNTIDNNARQTECICTKSFSGRHCHKYVKPNPPPPPRPNKEDIERASMAAAIIVGVVLIIVLVIVVLVVCRLRSQQEQQNVEISRSLRERNNGAASSGVTESNTISSNGAHATQFQTIDEKEELLPLNSLNNNSKDTTQPNNNS